MERLFTNQKLSAVRGGVSNSNRVISLLLSFALLLSMMPQMLLFPAFSVESDSASGTADYSAELGKIAVFNTAEINYFPFMESKPAGDWEDSALQLSAEDISADLVLEIKDYYVLEASYSSLWYQVTVVSGTAPEGFGSGCWVFQDYLGEDAYGVDSLILSEPPKVTDEATGVTVTGVLPEGAELSVEIPEIDGEALPGLFDIKIYKEDGTEWQPIDEGRKVTISIPVEGVEDGEYVDVYHYLDYEKAIDNSSVEYIAIEDIREDVLSVLTDAISISNQAGCIAIEVTENITVIENRIDIETDSFSVFYWNGTTYGDSDGNSVENRINFGRYNVDNGKTYFVTRGTTIYSFSGVGSWTYDTSAFTQTTEWSGANLIYKYTVQSGAEIYKKYTISRGNSSIHFVIMPELTINFICNLAREGLTIECPPMVDGIFMGNYNGTVPVDKIGEYADAGQYPALNYTFQAPAMTSDPTGLASAYTFSHWYVLHNPNKTFKAGTTEYLSNTTLEVNMDDKTASCYEVTLVAWYDLTDFVITYDPNGGSVAADSITNNQQTYTIEDSVTIPTPTWDDHVFIGWKVTSAAGNWTLNETILSGATLQDMYGNVTLTAQWAEEQDVTYTVEHYVQNTNLDTDLSTYLLYDTDTMVGTAGDQTNATAKSIQGFTASGAVTQMEIAEDGSTVVKIYYTRNTYTITFDSTGGTAVAPITQPYGETITKPYEPTKTGYNFHYWYDADAPTVEYVFNTMPAENLTLYAQWTVKKLTITYYDDDGTSIIFSAWGDYNTKIAAHTPDAREGYNFLGWAENKGGEVKYKAGDEITIIEDDALYAVWEEATHTVTFALIYDVKNGTEFQKLDVEHKGTVILPLPVPENNGYVFQNWTYKETKYQAGDTVSITSDMEFVAKWIPRPCLVSYVINGVGGGVAVPALGTHGGVYGTTDFQLKDIPVIEWHTFDSIVATGATSGNTYDITNNTVDLPAEDLVITITYTINKFKVQFVNEDGDVLQSGEVAYGETPIYTGETPTKAATAQYTYTFSGWKANGTTYGLGDTLPKVTGDVTYTATYSSTVNQYTITFKLGNGESDIVYTRDYGAAVTAPSNPSKTGYAFAGWAESENGTVVYKAGETITVTGNKTLYAVWTVNQYTITFESNGGSTVTAIKQDYNTAVTKPADPTREGYDFVGWFSDPELTIPYEFSTMPAENITLYAKWGVDFHTEIDNNGAIYLTQDGNTTLLGSNYDLDDALEGTWKGGSLVYKPAEGYEITKVLINGASQEFTLEEDGSFVHSLTNGITLDLDSIEVITGTIVHTVTFTIIIGEDEDQKVIEVLEGSDILIAFAPIAQDIKSVTVQYGEGEATVVKENVNGYIFEYQNISRNVNITVEAYDTVYSVVGTIDHGFVTLESAKMVDGYIPYGAEYTLTLTPDAGYQVKDVTDSSGLWNNSSLIFTGELTENRVVSAATELISYKITLDYGYDEKSEEKNYTVENAFDLPSPERLGYDFDGWKVTSTGGNWTEASYDATQVGPGMFGNVTLTAQWTKVSYTATFDYEDGSDKTDSRSYDIESALQMPVPTREGYTFSGWKVTQTAGNWELYKTYTSAEAGMYGAVTFEAQWTVEQYTITFETDGGTTIPAITLNYGAAVSAPSDPTKTGYTFTGWDKAIPATMPAEDITITAQWKINQYTITFVTGGGTSIAAITLDYGAAVTAPEDPTKRGYVFDGWDKAIPATMPAQNITITAKWKVRVQIGINMAYYMVGKDYYHTLPQTPTKLTNFPSVRAYFQNGAWVLTSTRGDYDHDVGRDFNLNIESLLEDHPIPSSDGTYGVLDPTGALVKTYFNFSSNETTDNGVYNALIEAWLGMDHSGMNMEIDWSKVKADDCSIIPYVVKLQDDGIWYVDMLVLVEKTSLTISVEDSDEVDSSHAFVYQISSDGMDTLTVVVRKDAPVTVDGLFIGKEYTVTQVADWSWKYSDKPDWSFEAIVGNESFTATGRGTLSAAITVRGGSNQLIFKQSLNDPGWLGGEGSSDQP